MKTSSPINNNNNNNCEQAAELRSKFLQLKQTAIGT